MSLFPPFFYLFIISFIYQSIFLFSCLLDYLLVIASIYSFIYSLIIYSLNYLLIIRLFIYLLFVHSPIEIKCLKGIACQAAVLCGLGTFGSAFLMGLGYFDSETAASSTFGSVVCLAGVVGTPLGGILLDYGLNRSNRESDAPLDSLQDNVEAEFEALNLAAHQQNQQEETEEEKNKNGLRCVAIIITIATFFGALCLCSVYFVYDRIFYLFLVTLGCLLVFLCNPGVNIGIMMSVPEKNR